MKKQTKTETKKTVVRKKTAPAVDPQRQYAVDQMYSGMRTMGHQPMVASAMMHNLGLSLEEIERAMKTHGDL